MANEDKGMMWIVEKISIPLMVAVFLGYQVNIENNKKDIVEGVTSTSVMQNELTYIKDDLVEIKATLKVAANDRYTSAMALKDYSRIQKQIDKLEQRQREKVERIMKLETKMEGQ